MLVLVRTTKFKKDVKLAEKRKKNTSKLKAIIIALANEETLDSKYRNHKLSGNYKDHWECHIEPDWLLIYRLTSKELILERTGSHSDLFKK
jgi:mRNA interferase YafQ